jgi:hypothetical protein
VLVIEYERLKPQKAFALTRHHKSAGFLCKYCRHVEYALASLILGKTC